MFEWLFGRRRSQPEPKHGNKTDRKIDNPTSFATSRNGRPGIRPLGYCVGPRLRRELSKSPTRFGFIVRRSFHQPSNCARSDTPGQVAKA